MELNALGIKVVLVEPVAFQTDIWTRGAVMGKAATKDSSPNFQRSLRVRERIGRLPKADSITVAKKIVEIAQNPNPKLRYVVGRDAKLQLAMKRVLPWKWHEKVIANFLRSTDPILSLRLQVGGLYRQVPVCVENLEAVLLFALESILVGIKLFL